MGAIFFSDLLGSWLLRWYGETNNFFLEPFSVKSNCDWFFLFLINWVEFSPHFHRWIPNLFCFPSCSLNEHSSICLCFEHRTINTFLLSNHTRLKAIRTHAHIRIAPHWSYNSQMMIYMCVLWYLVIVITSFITIKHTEIMANNRIICNSNVCAVPQNTRRPRH